MEVLGVRTLFWLKREAEYQVRFRRGLRFAAVGGVGLLDCEYPYSCEQLICFNCHMSCPAKRCSCLIPLFRIILWLFAPQIPPFVSLQRTTRLRCSVRVWTHFVRWWDRWTKLKPRGKHVGNMCYSSVTRLVPLLLTSALLISRHDLEKLNEMQLPAFSVAEASWML